MKSNVLEENVLTKKQKSLVAKLISNECTPHNSYLGITLCHNASQCKGAKELFRELGEDPLIYRTIGGYTPRCIYDVLLKNPVYKNYLNREADS